jgi:hypothetical protein
MTKISNQYSLTNILTADLANSRLGINNVSPTVALDVTGAGKFSGVLTGTTASFSGNGNFGSQPLQSWGSIFKAIQIGVSGSIVAATSATETDIALYSNTYYDGTNYKILNSTTQVPSYFQLGDGTLQLYTGNTGAIGSNVTGLTTKFSVSKTGSLLLAKNSVIGVNTSDGSDDGYLQISGGSVAGSGRGAFITLFGNERSGDQGVLELSAGNVIGIGSVITFKTTGVEKMRLIGNGRLLIGTSTDQGYLLFVNGNAAGTSGFANVSDIRLKKDITPIENGLDKINKLNGVYFNWDKTLRPDLNVDDKNHLGLIAQDVEEILPQVVITGEDEMQTKTIIYSDIVPVLIEAIKELSAENTSLINRIEALENK